MEIRVEEVLSGHAMKAHILAQYGSRQALERAAKDPRNALAQLHLVDLQHFEQDPRRLDLEQRTVTITILTPEELDLLSPARVRLLHALATAEEELNVTALAAAAGRDKKNVSEDLKVLVRLGLVRMVQRGREALPHPAGRRIEILLPGGRARRKASGSPPPPPPPQPSWHGSASGPRRVP